ncbi:SHOCT domain-containing protein [Mycobacterium persicum]|uniref:SHOCT domain-containing protein n=1 Tax=Mycobacterium persicum TaxID=1487726 RepID=UPI001F085C5E|nr:SHOCT domain-containing protein [Mycobacterium persicum]
MTAVELSDPERAGRGRSGEETSARSVCGWSGAPPKSSDPIDRLERLAALKDRGMLTDAEFEQQKRRVLGSWSS